MEIPKSPSEKTGFLEFAQWKCNYSKLAEILLLNRGNIPTFFTEIQQENRLFKISTGEHKHLDYLSDRHSQNQLKTNLQLTLETILNLKIL